MGSSPEQIAEVLAELRESSKALQKHIIEICWYMRGSVTWDQAWNLSPNSRKLIMKLIDDNVERVNKTGLPLL